MTRTSEKLAITLPRSLFETVKSAVATGKSPSVSAYIADAVARREREDTLATLVEELIAEHGEPDAEDYRWAEQALGLR